MCPQSILLGNCLLLSDRIDRETERRLGVWTLS